MYKKQYLMTPAWDPKLGLGLLSYMMVRILEGESLRRSHGGGISEVQSWTHLGNMWRQPRTLEAPRRDTRGRPGEHPGCTREAPKAPEAS